MKADVARQIRNNPAFAELIAKRNKFSWTLTIIMLVVYYGFILLVAFAKGVMAINVGGVVTLGFPLGLGVIACAIIITGLYVLRANGEYDTLTRKIVEDLS
jgi:uncharacterized membrane protein (DUF485 family)